MNDAAQVPERRRIRRGRLLLLLILGLPAVPITLAWLSFHTGIGVPEERRNQGILLHPPVSLAGLLPPPVGDNPQWTLLLSNQEQRCEDACRQLLYHTRQQHIALGRRSWRLRRIYLHGGELSPAEIEFFASEHPGLVTLPPDEALSARMEELRGRVAPRHGAPQAFLVDPRGFVLLAYGVEHQGKELLQDLLILMRVDAGSGGS